MRGQRATHSYAWIVSARVLEGLKARGVDMFKVEPFDEKRRFPRI